MAKNTPLAALKEAVKIAGGPSKLAASLGISRQRMHCWLHLNNTRGCAPEFSVAVEELTGVSRHQLCPRVFGDEPL